jgi:hypothetical protein
MQFPRKLVLVGALISLIPIALSIAAFATPSWVNVTARNQTSNFNFTIPYSLLVCNNTLCPSTSPLLRTVQGLEISGFMALLLGVVAFVVLDILTESRLIHLLPQILLIIGPTLVLVGLILYPLYVMTNFTFFTSYFIINSISFGYSFILMLIACIVGYVIAIYFAFLAGFGRYGARQQNFRF